MPNKVKVFAWRACRNILPTKAKLFTRKVTQDDVCEECGVGVESSGHLFWHCSRAQEVWKASNLGLEAVLGEIHEFIDLVWYARNVKQMDTQALAQFFMVAWGIWSNRNEIRTGGSRKSASLIVRWTLDYLEEFQVANHTVQIKSAESECGWSLPHAPGFKVNVDAAIFENLCSVGIGVVIRDQLGSVRAAMSKKLRAMLGPLETEAKAMEEGLRFAWDRGFRAAMFEGDSLLVHQVLTSSAIPPASISNIISGVLSQASQFDECVFSFTRRTGNKVAHALAQHARHLSDSSIWLEEYPSFIENLVSQDVLFLSSF